MYFYNLIKIYIYCIFKIIGLVNLCIFVQRVGKSVYVIEVLGDRWQILEGIKINFG